MERRFLHRVAVLSVVALLGACTGGERTPGPDATAVATDSEDGALGPGATTPPPIFDETDDVLNVAIPEPATLDPLRIHDPGSTLVARQLYEGLTRWDPVVEKVRPAAAQSWRASPDGTTFLFRLRPGMTFHDGSPVTSRDFSNAFDRIALKGNAAELAYTLADVAGFQEVNQTGTSGHLSGITTPNDTTLVIQLSRPFHDFPAMLTHPALVPIPGQALTDPDAFLTQPIGNGPFQMAEPWTPGESVTLEAFPGFIKTPELDGIRFLSYPDSAASWVDFVRGDIDVAEVPAGQIRDAEERFGSEGFQPFLKSEYYGLNLRSRAMKNVRLRRAINHAIDRRAISRAVYRGTLEEPRGIVPTGMPGFQENLCVDLCNYDPDKAKALVRRVPRKQRKVTIEFTRGGPSEAAVRFVQKDLADVGLRVSTKRYAFPAFLRRLQEGASGAYRLGWIAEYPVPDEFLSPLFASDSPDNHSGFASARVDALLAEAHRSASEGKRLLLYAEAEKAIMASAPIIPIGSFETHWAAQRDVRAIEFDVMGGFDAAEVFLAEN